MLPSDEAYLYFFEPQLFYPLSYQKQLSLDSGVSARPPVSGSR